MNAALFWLLIQSVLILVKADVNNRYEDVELFAVRNNTDGIELRVVSDCHDVVSDCHDVTFAFHGQYLPTECGDNSFRCEDLMSFAVSGKEVALYAIFVPVKRAVLIIILQYNYTSFNFDVFDNYTLEVPTHCSPTKFFTINGHMYTTCMNLEERFLTAFELYLNTSFIQTSYFSSQPLIDNLYLPNASQISRFVYVDLGDGVHAYRHQILFLTGNYLKGFDPSVYRLATSVDIEHESCLPTSEMRYLGNQILLVYCSDSAVYVDLTHQLIHQRLRYDEGGYPYLCSSNDAKFLYFSNTSCLSYQRYQACSNISNISTGRCIGTGNNIFVYSDTENGTVNTVAIAADGNVTRMMLSPDSDRVKIFNDRYVVFGRKEENGTIEVVDSQANFSPIITARNLQPDLMTIVSVKQPLPSPTFPPIPEPTSLVPVPVQPTSVSTPMVATDSHTISTEVHVSISSQNKGIMIAVTCSAVSAFGVVVVTAAVIVIAYKTSCWRCTKLVSNDRQDDCEQLILSPIEEVSQEEGASRVVAMTGTTPAATLVPTGNLSTEEGAVTVNPTESSDPNAHKSNAGALVPSHTSPITSTVE